MLKELAGNAFLFAVCDKGDTNQLILSSSNLNFLWDMLHNASGMKEETY